MGGTGQSAKLSVNDEPRHGAPTCPRTLAVEREVIRFVLAHCATIVAPDVFFRILPMTGMPLSSRVVASHFAVQVKRTAGGQMRMLMLVGGVLEEREHTEW